MSIWRRGNRCSAAALVVLAGLLFALLVAGCGSSDQAATAEKPPVTKKQFERQAHKVCFQLYHKQARQTEALSKRRDFQIGEPTQRQREVINRVIVMPIVREKIKELGALPLPPGEAPKMKAVLGSMRRGIRLTEAHPEWLAAPTEKHPETFAEARETTGAAGIWLCGQA